MRICQYSFRKLIHVLRIILLTFCKICNTIHSWR
nr:MAG TPA: hypothetical protein [Caudoviricetes sp.]